MRSQSVQRGTTPLRYKNPILQTQEESPDGRSSRGYHRVSHRRLDSNNFSAYVAQEILKNNSVMADIKENPVPDTLNDLPVRDTLQSLPSQRDSAIPNGFPHSWGEYMQRQGEIGNTIEQTERIERKLRAHKYKESLDEMVQEEKRKKIENHREYIAPPNPDIAQLGTYIQMEKVREQEEKKAYSAQLEKLIRQQTEIRMREMELKTQENENIRRNMEQLKEYDRQAVLEERKAQKYYMDVNKNLIDQKYQDFEEQKKHEQELATQSGQFLTKQDQERSRHYENIKNRSEFYNLRANYIVGDQYAKIRRINDFVNKGIQQATEKDTLEMKRRHEARQRMQTETFLTNKMQAQEKYSRAQKERQNKLGDYEQNMQNKKIVDQIEGMRKELEQKQKQEYLNFLRRQARDREENKNYFNHISADEQLMNFGREGSQNHREDINNPILNGRSHERNLQLRYLDNWLKNSPPRAIKRNIL